MIPKLEVFFDYACPYCQQGHESLLELLPQYPQVEIVWYPCEAHAELVWQTGFVIALFELLFIQ